MSKTKFDGIITQALPSGKFKIDVDGKEIIGYPSGKMRKFLINIAVSDKVEVEIDSYNPDIGRIVFRKRS